MRRVLSEISKAFGVQSCKSVPHPSLNCVLSSDSEYLLPAPSVTSPVLQIPDVKGSLSGPLWGVGPPPRIWRVRARDTDPGAVSFLPGHKMRPLGA